MNFFVKGLGTVKGDGKNRKLIRVTLTLMISLSIFVSIFGIVMVCLVKPGSGGGFSNTAEDKPKITEKTRSQKDSIYDTLM